MRQSAAEIDHAILDVAAGIFARHGFAHTSVQQIADAVGYSKPGLLHRFGTKEALHRAVMTEVLEIIDGLVDHAVSHAAHPDQHGRLLDLVVRRALARPGVMQLVLELLESEPDDPGTDRSPAGERLVAALDLPPGRPPPRLRVTLALRLVATAAMSQHLHHGADLRVPEDELVPWVVDVARNVLVDRAL